MERGAWEELPAAMVTGPQPRRRAEMEKQSAALVENAIRGRGAAAPGWDNVADMDASLRVGAGTVSASDWGMFVGGRGNRFASWTQAGSELKNG